MTYDVELPRRQEPYFADKCVVCGRESPGAQVRLVTGVLGWWTFLLAPFGSAYVHVVKAPACRGCRFRLHGWRIASLLVTVAITLAVALYLGPILEGMGFKRSSRKWLLLGVVAVCLLPQFYFEEWFPPPIQITALPKRVIYSFRDRTAAVEFRALNDAQQLGIT